MISLLQYLTRPRLPREYDGQIYKHLWHTAMIEGVLYISTLLIILIFKD